MSNIARYLISVVTCLLFVFSGCAVSLIVKDDLPANAEKGYVEFYSFELTSLQKDMNGDQVSICTYNNGATKYEGALYSTDANKHGDFIRLRIAKAPGLYTFIVNIPTLGINKVQLQIEKDQLTPVRIMAVQRESYVTVSGDKRFLNTSFEAKVIPSKKSLPLIISKENNEYLRSLLTDDDWGLRYYAIDYLVSNAQVWDSAAVESLAKVALNDRHEIIRARAEESLNDVKEDPGTKNSIRKMVKIELSKIKTMENNILISDVNHVRLKELDVAGILMKRSWRVCCAEMLKPFDSIRSGYVDFYREIEKCTNKDNSTIYVNKIDNGKRTELGFISFSKNNCNTIDVLRIEDTEGYNEYELSSGKYTQSVFCWVKNNAIITVKTRFPGIGIINNKSSGLNDFVHRDDNIQATLSDKYIPTEFISENTEDSFCDAMKSVDRLTRYYAAGYIVYLKGHINNQIISSLCDLLVNETDKDVAMRALASVRKIASMNPVYRKNVKDILLNLAKKSEKAKKYLHEI